jgi:hypothetical protein
VIIHIPLGALPGSGLFDVGISYYLLIPCIGLDPHALFDAVGIDSEPVVLTDCVHVLSKDWNAGKRVTVFKIVPGTRSERISEQPKIANQDHSDKQCNGD